MLNKSIFALLLTTCSACSTLNSPPSANIMQVKPRVLMGTALPDHNDYILHLPANSKLPISLEISGSIFHQATQAKLSTQTNKSLYFYREWVSDNGKEWHPIVQRIKFDISAAITADAARIGVTINETE